LIVAEISPEYLAVHDIAYLELASETTKERTRNQEAKTQQDIETNSDTKSDNNSRSSVHAVLEYRILWKYRILLLAEKSPDYLAVPDIGCNLAETQRDNETTRQRVTKE
jgi:hypothetical protein